MGHSRRGQDFLGFFALQSDGGKGNVRGKRPDSGTGSNFFIEKNPEQGPRAGSGKKAQWKSGRAREDPSAFGNTKRERLFLLLNGFLGHFLHDFFGRSFLGHFFSRSFFLYRHLEFTPSRRCKEWHGWIRPKIFANSILTLGINFLRANRQTHFNAKPHFFRADLIAIHGRNKRWVIERSLYRRWINSKNIWKQEEKTGFVPRKFRRKLEV